MLPESTVYRYDVATNVPSERQTPLYGGIIDGPMTLEKSKSPYLARDDVIIGPKGVLEVEPGVVVRFAPMVGITVRGILNIRVSLFIFGYLGLKLLWGSVEA